VAAGVRTGCRNSLGVGASLRATGVAQVTADSVTLVGTGMPNSAALYFHGLRCVAGSVVRLGTKFNTAGGSQWPAAGDPSVSVRGVVPAGATRNYQVWYRNSGVFCTASTFNLSNGLSVTWAP
jgi:hypothetical protein